MFRDEAALREEITQAGFRPAPLAGVLHTIRRLVWPVIRQYHFAVLDILNSAFSQTENTIDVERRRIDELSEECRLLRRDLQRSIGASLNERQVLESEIRNLRLEMGERAVQVHRNVAAQITDQFQHQYTLRIAEVDERLRLLQQRADEQFAGLGEQVRATTERAHGWLDEMQKSVPVLTALRSDVAALANREQVLARELTLFRSDAQRRDSAHAQAAEAVAHLWKSQQELEVRIAEFDRLRVATDQRLAADRGRMDQFDASLAAAQASLTQQVAGIRTSQQQLSERLTETERLRADQDMAAAHEREQGAERERARVADSARLEAEFAALQQAQVELARSIAELGASLGQLRQREATHAAEQTGVREHVDALASQLAGVLSAVETTRSELVNVRAEHQAHPRNGVDADVLSRELAGVQAAVADAHTAKQMVLRLETAVQEMTTARARLEGEISSIQARVESALIRIPDQYREAVYQSALASAEIKAEVAVLRSGLSRVETGDSRALTRLGEVERRTAALESVAGQIQEHTAAHGELEYRSRIYLRQTNGGLFILKRGDLISDHLASGQPWDPHILEVARDIGAARSGVAVDVGGHFGETAAALADMFERVVTFEPNTFNYSFLRANMALKRLGNVDCLPVALYSKECEISLGRSEVQEFPLPINPAGGFDGMASPNLGSLMFTENGSGVLRQMSRTLDSFRLDNVSFIKVDAQGADGEVLFGAAETLRRCRPVVVFEWEKFLSGNFSKSFEDVKELLESIGYSVQLLYKTNDKQADYIARCQ